MTHRQLNMEPINAIEEIRKDVERLGGSIGDIRSTAKWVELHGPFTPEQLRRIAKEVDKKFKDRT